MDHFLSQNNVVSYAVLVGFCVWLGAAAIDRLFAPMSAGNFVRQICDILLKVMCVLFFCLLVATVIAIILAVYHAIVSSGT